jgi:pimeloyl-ACP methyl ester carboxylesterase
VYTPTLTGLGERAHLAQRDVGLSTHVDDVANTLIFEDLHDVLLVGNSSAGTVITGVADRVPERIREVVYLDAFVPADGESTFDLIPPDRRPVMEQLVKDEGDGWLLPRFAPPPWEQFVPASWDVTDEADLSWAIERLRPTPFLHFTEPLRLHQHTAAQPHRVYIRCTRWPHPGFDRWAEAARENEGWSCCELTTSHLPYITNPDEFVGVLRELEATRSGATRR